jgi:hypothetical protein
VHLGITAAEFYAMTPRYFAAVRRAWERKEWEQHRSVALLRMDLINFSMSRPKEPVKLDDLLHPLPEAVERPRSLAEGSGRPVRMTPWRRREVADNWRRFMSSGFAGYTTVETLATTKEGVEEAAKQ